MTVLRITKIATVIKYWDFFRTGLNSVRRFLRYNVDIENLRQILFHIVRQPSAWVGVVFDDNDNPLCFGAAHEVTPLFAKFREYEVSILYYKPGQEDAVVLLQTHFELFCKAQQVKTYYVTTRRDSGCTIRCFQGPRYGLRRRYTVFGKDIL